MRKNSYNKTTKNNNQAREREFDEMKTRLMNDFRNERKNNNTHYSNNRNYSKKTYDNRNMETNDNEGTEFTGPVSHTDDFIKSVKTIVNKCTSMINSDECTIKIYDGRKKEATGAVFVKVTIEYDEPTSENSNEKEFRSETLVFYFTEDHSINPKKKNFVKNYMEHILIINQKSGNVLFNKFGYQIIDKAAAYIEKMILKNIELVAGVPIMETSNENE